MEIDGLMVTFYASNVGKDQVASWLKRN